MKMITPIMFTVLEIGKKTYLIASFKNSKHITCNKCFDEENYIF